MSTCPVFSFGKNAHSDRADNEATDDVRFANRCARDSVLSSCNNHRREIFTACEKLCDELSVSTYSSHWMLEPGTERRRSQATWPSRRLTLAKRIPRNVRRNERANGRASERATTTTTMRIGVTTATDRHDKRDKNVALTSSRPRLAFTNFCFLTRLRTTRTRGRAGCAAGVYTHTHTHARARAHLFFYLHRSDHHTCVFAIYVFRARSFSLFFSLGRRRTSSGREGLFRSPRCVSLLLAPS